MADLEVRDLSRGDRDAALDVRHRSFGPISPGSLTWWDPLFEKTVDERRALGVYHGDRLVAMARIHAYRQLWGGRPVPMAGVAGVIVSPEWRGQGVATLLMNATLDRAVERGDAVAVLFPATMPPYRKLGFEVAGTVVKTSFPAAALRALGTPAIAVRRPTAGDADLIADLMRREATRRGDCGPLDLSTDDIRELLDDSDNICYLAADGVLVYAWDGQDLRVERLVAESSETTRALWAIVGSGASAVRHVYTYQPVHDPIHWILDEKPRPEVEQERWMMRVLDAPAAIAQRGFPCGVRADVRLRLVDPQHERCTGAFRLRIADGGGELAADHEDEKDAVQLGPNGLAALYAGTPMWTIRNAGLVSGGTLEQHALLDAAFAAHPFLLDTF
jgi:predicted acetyltransferase